MWINSCLYCQVVVPVISSDHGPSSSSSSPRKVQTIVFISSFLCAQLLFADRLICCGLGQVCEMWFEKETVQIGNVLIDWAGEVWAGAGGAPRMGPNVSCGLEFSRQPAPAPAPYTALAPSADFWYRLTGRGGGGLLAAVPRAETTQPSQPQPADTLSNSVHPSALACQYAMRTRDPGRDNSWPVPTHGVEVEMNIFEFSAQHSPIHQNDLLRIWIFLNTIDCVDWFAVRNLVYRPELDSVDPSGEENNNFGRDNPPAIANQPRFFTHETFSPEPEHARDASREWTFHRKWETFFGQKHKY